MFELTGGFRVGDVIWYGALGPSLRFRIVSVHKDLMTGVESCEAEVIQSRYRREDGYTYHLGSVVSLEPSRMFRLIERDVLALDWMCKEQWNLGERLSRSESA